MNSKSHQIYNTKEKQQQMFDNIKNFYDNIKLWQNYAVIKIKDLLKIWESSYNYIKLKNMKIWVISI